MSILYLLEQNSTLAKEGNRLLVKKDGDTLHTLHSFKLDQIVVFGNVFLTPAVIRHVLRNGIDTVFMSVGGKYLGRLQAPQSKNIVLRKAQFRRADDEDFTKRMARGFIAGKLANLRTVLMRLNRTRPEVDLSDNILGIRNLIDKLESAPDLDSLRGYEGRASVLYFEGFAKGFLSDEFSFEKRVRRPPTDPVNALLSLGYTLLFNSVMAAVEMAGFDPYVGSLHSIEYGRPSLPLDLMEEWRPIIIDTLVLGVINLKTLRQEDFVYDAAAADEKPDIAEEAFPDEQPDKEPREQRLPVRLTDEGFRKYITQFERKMLQQVFYAPKEQTLSYRDCIKEQAYHFARCVRGEEEAYCPMELK